MKNILTTLTLISAFQVYAVGQTYNSEGFFLNSMGTKNLAEQASPEFSAGNAPEAAVPEVSVPEREGLPPGEEGYNFKLRDDLEEAVMSSLETDTAAEVEKKDEGEAFEYWYPMCLFMEQGAVSYEGGNKTVKGMVDDAAACGVNLVVFPFMISATQDNPEWINSNAQRLCNITAGLKVKRASVSTCVRHDKTADEMCGKKDPDPNKPSTVAGCGMLQSGGGETFTDAQKARMKEHLGENANYSGSGAAPSIEDMGQCTAAIVSHEALGHGMWGHPNGESDGNGIGLEEKSEGKSASAGKAGGAWTSAGCAAMRANAFSNNGFWKYKKDKDDYFKESKDPNSVLSLDYSAPIWEVK